jgi:hypothetical protein
MDKQYFPRRFVIICIFISLCIPLFAEAPELRKVMPNSWQKIDRLPAGEETAFLNESRAIITQIHRLFDNKGLNHYPSPNYLFVYKQLAGNDIFYRILCTDIAKPDFLSNSTQFIQCLVYNNRLVMTGGYRYLYSGRHDNYVFSSIDIIEKQGNPSGILLTYMMIRIDDETHEYITYWKNQLVGHVCGSYYFLIDGLGTASDFSYFEAGACYSYKDCPYIRIDASECLVDPNIPLRYTLQNAFDGDPATSYVENTENDMLDINIQAGTQKIAIINGYAQNEDLYMKNNRVKKLAWPLEIELEDGQLEYQFLKVPDTQAALLVHEIYRGTKYNDTCIAEFNIKTENGWLFGDINDE